MAQLADRHEREVALAEALAKVSAEHRAELIELLGDPPDINRVPPEFWEKVKRDTSRQMLGILLLAFMDSAVNHGMAADLAMQHGVEHALSATRDTGERLVNGTKNLFAKTVARADRDAADANLKGARKAREAGTAYKPITRADLLGKKQVVEFATKAFGPSKVTQIAQTHVVRAQNRGASTAVRASGQRIVAYWRHSDLRPKHHAGAAVDPCETCTPLEGKPWWEWGGLEPGFAHDNCDCMAVYYMPLMGEFLGPAEDPAGLDAWAEEFGIGNQASPVGTLRTGSGLPWESAEEATDYTRHLLLEAERDTALRQRIADASKRTDTDPSEAQVKAGNYSKGKFHLHGLRIAIENPRGSVRRGRTWTQKMRDHYGYFSAIDGIQKSAADGDHVDVFVGPDPESELAFVIDQQDQYGKFNEHKVMLGWHNEAEARAGYLSNYSPGWTGLKSITPMTLPQLRAWLKGDTSKPVAESLHESLYESTVRKIVSPPRGEDGLFVQPDDDSPEREQVETHNRERFANHFHYADAYAGNARTYDEKGNYNCGRCNMATGDKCLLVKPLKIDRDAGSCGDWENLDGGDPEMPLGEKTIETAVYGIAANGKGFGCHRCPFASKAHEPDSQGRDLYCGKGDFRVFPNACCGLNGAETLPIDDKGNIKRADGTAATSESLLEYDPDQERDDHGRWSSGGGAATVAGEHAPNPGSHAGTKDDPIVCGNDLDLAVRSLAQGKHVQLSQPDQVGTLLHKMNDVVHDAISKGEKAPTYNLCQVSVPGTNLFCAESKGLPRAKMPQLKGYPVPGSPADSMPKNGKGKVNIASDFVDKLRGEGIKVTEEHVLASHLRATQGELDGAKVAELVSDPNKASKKLNDRIFVTRDNYILDGHHHWAMAVGLQYASHGPTLQIPVYRVDMDIGTAITKANDFARDKGIKPKSLTEALLEGRQLLEFNPEEERDDHGRWSGSGGGGAASVAKSPGDGDRPARQESPYRQPVIDGLMKNVMGRSLGGSGLTKETQEHYANSARQVLGSMSDHALAAFSEHVKGTSFYESPEKLTEGVGKQAVLPLGVKTMGGAWLGSKTTGHGTLHLDGDFQSSYGDKGREIAAQVYAHEFSHAIDWDRKTQARISSTPEWNEAWKSEIVGDAKAPAALTEYARSKPVEGWAEFGRLIHTQPDMAQKFPKCLAIWLAHNYVR